MSDVHWSRQEERKSLTGILGFKILWALYCLGGRPLFTAALLPVILVFWLTGKTQRQAVEGFLTRMERERKKAGMAPSGTTSFEVFFSFAQSILEKMVAWRSGLKWNEHVVYGDEETPKLLIRLAQAPRGTLVLASHLGVAEASRALSETQFKKTVNVLMFDRHAPRFKRMMDEVAPEASQHIWAVDELGLDTAERLREAIDAGDWVAIAADRTPLGELDDKRTVAVPFMGDDARFPVGPFVLANLLKCHVITIFALRDAGKIKIFARDFAPEVALGRRQERPERLKAYVGQYAQTLEHFAMHYPLNWFNFYDYWARPNSKKDV